MLTHLYIKNFALIEELDIDFHAGFSVITGETGAGKSIILGAIGLLLGNRAELRYIMQGKEKCIVEGHFNLQGLHLHDFFQQNDIEFEETDCIIRRELNVNGKSRAFVNDTPVSLNAMRELGIRLIDIHSQHQNLLLANEDFQLRAIDTIAQDSTQLSDYQNTYSSYIEVKKELEQAKKELEDIRRSEELLRFQFQELSAAQLDNCSQEELEQESKTMSHEEDIKRELYATEEELTNEGTGALSQLRSAGNHLQTIASLLPQANDWISRIESCRIELDDLTRDFSSTAENISYDPRRLEEINAQLNTLYSLQQKYHVQSVEELISIRDDIEQQLTVIDTGDEHLRKTEENMNALYQSCLKKADLLSKKRQSATKTMTSDILSQLQLLGMPKAKFEIAFDSKPLTIDGADKATFLFSANSGQAPQPVSLIASGGEIARFMLALKALISGIVRQPTIIFDEIDTGVGGSVAEKMAQIMLTMGQTGRQVICITHLPQIAALGQHHYRVEKTESEGSTLSRMQYLSADERVTEIALMLSGHHVTQAAIDNAKELLSANKTK